MHCWVIIYPLLPLVLPLVSLHLYWATTDALNCIFEIEIAKTFIHGPFGGGKYPN